MNKNELQVKENKVEVKENKIQKFFKNIQLKHVMAFAFALMIMVLPLLTAHAAGPSINFDQDPDFETIGKNIVTLVLRVAYVIGGGLVIWAGIDFGLSISNDNPDQRARAIKFLLGGLAIVALPSILRMIGVVGW